MSNGWQVCITLFIQEYSSFSDRRVNPSEPSLSRSAILSQSSLSLTFFHVLFFGSSVRDIAIHGCHDNISVGARGVVTSVWNSRNNIREATSSVGEKHRTFPMARPKCLMGDFTNLYGIYTAHQTNVWWTMQVFRLHCTSEIGKFQTNVMSVIWNWFLALGTTLASATISADLPTFENQNA